MHKKLISTICLLMMSAAVNAETAPMQQMNNTVQQDSVQQQALRAEAIAKIKTFGSTLKGVLISAIQDQGLAHAVSVCQTQAPKIGAELSTDGWDIRRTSLRARNADNKADAWEHETLVSFDESFKAGTPAQALMVDKLSDNEYRLMKAIPTDKVCLACHGSSVDPQLQQTINSYYPQDTATGFALGDIRGAFTLTKAL